MEIFTQFKGFEWDKWNKNKNYEKHRVSWIECEEVFFNEPLYLFHDDKHSKKEERYYVLGRTNLQRLFFIVFTKRGDKIRIISARDMNKKERRTYYEKIKENT